MMQTDNPASSPATSGTQPGDTPFQLTGNAEQRLAKLLQDEPPGSLLRVSVMGGGCSGFQYRFDFEATPPMTDDYVIDNGAVRVAVDATSLEFLRGAALDYVESLGGAAFEIRNPNSTSSCGCGNSFSVM